MIQQVGQGHNSTQYLRLAKPVPFDLSSNLTWGFSLACKLAVGVEKGAL